MKKAVAFFGSFAPLLASAKPIEQLEPGVFRIPLEKKPVTSLEENHISLERPNHPMVGNWSEAEMWD